MDKLFFRSVDDCFVETEQDIIDDAKLEGLEEITVLEAIPDDGTHGIIWCTVSGSCVEKTECRKAQCSDYTSKSGRGVCSNRGNLYLHGKEVTIKIQPNE